ncbi:TRAP transporter substrate-binding protein [Alisedimentitalea sp. MJ-SS2]|uniref:TRAP transporter substrate-binding protein n=1 Tax=Aliisedimentitalea sp. MJ-SS2 TaxID=3049795 RepID=UPI00291472D2|nr:TRAP transporter substrate-binding protein [Alisedimentitalea sp. MJ-SS2]MDU8925875.1 TRAP transporter substrate-binding protein [Alisedimentitalea sp. MJ-SS2]
MINKRNLMGLLAGTAMAVAAGSTAMAQEVTLKMHQFLPAQANVPKLILDPWARRVEEASGGKIKIDHYPSMQLGGKPPHLMSQVEDGVADIVWTVLGYTPGRFPSSEVFELPFMMTNGEDTSRAMWQFAEANMMDTEFANIKVLAVWVHGPGLIHSKAPIKSVKDLNGVKLRAPSRMTNKLFTELGATAVGMPVPAVPEALSKGVIDATVIPWEVTGALKVPELVENHTEFGDDSLYTVGFALAMNKQKWDSLSDEMKAAMDSVSGEELSALAGKLMQGADAGSREAAAGRGNNIMTLTSDEVQEWKDAAAGIEAGWIEEINGYGMDGQALVDQARELIKKNSM